MKLPKGLSRGFEAISHQGSSLLFKELTIALTELTSTLPITPSRMKKSGIEEIVRKRTGLSITLKMDNSPHPNAYVYPPDIDKNNPIVNYFWAAYGAVTSKDSLKRIKKEKTTLKGTIDLKGSTVSGLYSEVKCKTFLTKGLLESGQFEPGEIAGILLHELGHLFSYFEYLEFNLTTNTTLQAAMHQYFDAEGSVRKHEIVSETQAALGIELDDPDALINVRSREVFQTILLREAVRQNKSTLGSGIYDYTAWEAASDQFAARHGAGRELVTGLDKMFKMYGSPAHRSTVKHVIFNGLTLLLFLGALGIGFFPALLVLFINPAVKIYDPETARIKRIRQELIAGLKDPHLDKETKEKISIDVKAIDKIMEPMKDRRSWLEFFHTSIMPKGRKQYSQLQFQKDLESMANNDLFLAAARLETLNV